MPPLYVSFYTTDGYAAEAAELGKTLDQWNLPHELVPVTPFASWVQACAYKPQFLLHMRRKHGPRPLVWVDADARVRQLPELLEAMPPDVDFAAHWKGGTELLSGTMYFGANDATYRLLVRWAFACKISPQEWDQRVLQRVIGDGDGLNICRLPPEYTAIYDAGMCLIPVVEHMQASRRLRR